MNVYGPPSSGSVDLEVAQMDLFHLHLRPVALVSDLPPTNPVDSSGRLWNDSTLEVHVLHVLGRGQRTEESGTGTPFTDKNGAVEKGSIWVNVKYTWEHLGHLP